jgi:hypothetical protein
MDGTVWYASYGSNMWWERFRCYLEGGVPPGATHEHVGARDATPPSASQVVRIPHTMYFAGRARGWEGGGVSFLDHGLVGKAESAWGRAWQITAEQFDDVVAQENGLAPGALHLDLTGVVPGEARAVTDGWYGRLVVVDVVDGMPLVTFTSLRPMSDATLNSPSAPYLRTLTSGLAECSDLEPADIGTYLATAPGAAGSWDIEEVIALA